MLIINESPYYFSKSTNDVNYEVTKFKSGDANPRVPQF